MLESYTVTKELASVGLGDEDAAMIWNTAKVMASLLCFEKLSVPKVKVGAEALALTCIGIFVTLHKEESQAAGDIWHYRYIDGKVLRYLT